MYRSSTGQGVHVLLDFISVLVPINFKDLVFFCRYVIFFDDSFGGRTKWTTPLGHHEDSIVIDVPIHTYLDCRHDDDEFPEAKETKIKTFIVKT
jgi:hypothetical protein